MRNFFLLYTNFSTYPILHNNITLYVYIYIIKDLCLGITVHGISHGTRVVAKKKLAGL